MIHRAKFQNFKALKDVEVTFDERLTVLVGPNGSGKSSVLNCVYSACVLAGDGRESTGMAQYLVENAKNTYSGLSDDQLLELVETTDHGTSGVRFRTHPDARRMYSARVSGQPLPGQRWLCESISPNGISPIQAIAFQSRRLSFIPAELVQLHAGSLAKPTLTTVTPPPMNSFGEGVASLMAYFKLYDEPRFDQVVGLFQKVIPQVQRIRIDRVPVSQQGTMGEGLVFDLPGRKGTPASSMSDGTLYALGLIVKILDPQRPRTLLIDDIDHGFHPKAQLTLVELLHKLLDEIPDLQIIATSHSPYILDRLKWSEVRVTSLKDDGSAVVARLEDHPDFDRWKDSMSPGEFWSTFYEEWATKTKPALQPVP